ncbi:class I SAM-dependent methyltransferase [Spirosoma sp. KUDC1026]|uniref:class I SAM-dependent methyltransferase n=1 Tax=Spirosoma sp. KUDC1026 TaxID=2745947 RepID=UPI00159BB25A|nr:class I SAM-dependent methyltransferase [Spirosoma sp. KUDC1026]QKZ13388.1 class I SAM-dependent methyltransferase [Spirosoma sp. KUDC1026]
MGFLRSVGGNFDGVAPLYDALSFLVFGRQLEQAQTAFLQPNARLSIPKGASVLVVGGGTGKILQPLLQNCQPDRVVYLDKSARMLARASQRMAETPLTGTVEFRLGDETALRSSERFDVLITPYLLDLFTETTLATQLLPKLGSVLAEGGYWLVTDFVRTGIWWHEALIWSMIRFFRFTAGIETRQLADWQKLMPAAGLRLKAFQSRMDGLISAELYRKSSIKKAA